MVYSIGHWPKTNFWSAAWDLLYAPSSRHNEAICGALVGMRNSSRGPPDGIYPTTLCFSDPLIFLSPNASEKNILSELLNI